MREVTTEREELTIDDMRGVLADVFLDIAAHELAAANPGCMMSLTADEAAKVTATAHSEFDRWLEANNAQVRVEERERISAAIRESIPYGYGMNPDGTEDSCAMAYVAGINDAYNIARAGAAS